MNQLYCDQCGASIEPGDRFCLKCGAPVAEAQAPAKPPRKQKNVPPPDREDQAPANHKAKSGSWKMMLFVATGVLILGGIVFFAMSSSNQALISDSSKDNQPPSEDRREPVEPRTEEPTAEPDTTIADQQPETDQQMVPENQKSTNELPEVELSQKHDQPDPPPRSLSLPDDPPAVRATLPPGQFGTWSLQASSALPPVKGLTYGPANVAEGGREDAPPLTAWVEGKQGDGIGEWIQFIFGDADDALTFSSLTIVNGYAKSSDAFQKNSRVKLLHISHAEGVESVQLQDTSSQQTIRLKSPVRTHWIRLTIESVYPGTTYQDTAISWISFNIEDFNYYPPLEGRSIPSPDGDLVAWIIPKRSGSSGSSENLVQIWRSAVEGKNTMPKAVGAYDHSSESGSHGRVVDNAGWSADSRFFVYTTFSSGGHSPWHAQGFFFDQTTGRVTSLSDYGIVILKGEISFEAPAFLIATVQRKTGDLDGSKVKVDLTKLSK